MPFATYTDVEARLGRELGEAEQAIATDVIAQVTAQIVDEVDRDSDWAADLDPVPGVLKGLCVSKAAAAVTNPALGVVAAESLGAHSVTYARSNDADGLWLSERECRMARQAVYGTTSGSSTPRALHDRLIDLNEGRDVDEIEAE